VDDDGDVAQLDGAEPEGRQARHRPDGAAGERLELDRPAAGRLRQLEGGGQRGSHRRHARARVDEEARGASAVEHDGRDPATAVPRR
jgi:hypothetical protein